MKTFSCSAIAALLCVLCLPVVAQEVTGSIVGTVTDPTGAAVAGATVTVTAVDRNLNVRTLQTDTEGNYVATFLPVGSYQVKVELKGFKPAARSGIELHVSDKLTVSLRLEVGDVALMRNIRIREGMRVQVRVEGFNLPNHTNFQAVSTSLGATNFG